MKLLFVDRKGAASIWQVISPVAADLVKDGHAVRFVRLDDGSTRPPTPVPAGIIVHDLRVPAKKPLVRSLPQHAAFARQFRALLQDFVPDVVHTNFCVPGVVARTTARMCGVQRVVSTQHELYGSMNPLYRLAVRLTEHQADAIVYVSEAVALSFNRSPASLAARGRDRDRTRHLVIHNGVDIDELTEVRRHAGPVQEDKLVCAGRLVPVKGQRLLIEALPAVLAERPDVRLVLLGAGPDEDHLRRLVARARIGGKVEFRGWVPHQEALREMATAGAVILPSLPIQEGLGLALVEAMGVGAPVVASRIPVFEEVAGTTSRHVRFFQNQNPASLAEAILMVLSRAHASLGKRMPDPRVASLFSMRRMVESYRALYRAIEPDRQLDGRCGAS